MADDRLTELLRAGRLDEAERLAGERLDARAEDPDALLALARIRLVSGRVAEAEALWTRAGAGGRSFAYRLVEAALLAQKGASDEALSLYEGLLAEDPGSGEARFGAGYLLLARERFAEAEEHLARAVEIDPRNAPALFHHASALARRGKAGEALESLRRAMELNPAYLPAYFVLADLFDAAGQPDKAIEVLATGLEVFPGQPDLTAAATNRLAARGEWARAHQLAFDAARAHPDNPHAVANLARFLMSARRFDEALGLVERLAREGRATVESCLVEGMIAEAQDPPRWDGAEAAYRRAAQVDPRDWSGPNNLGLVLLRREGGARLAEAVEAFREAVRRDPRAPEPRVNLARARARDGAPPREILEILDPLEGAVDERHPLHPELARLRDEARAVRA